MSGITLDTIDAALHSIAISDGTDTLAIEADGSITVNASGGSFAVTATDLDIRDLTHVSDSVSIGDGTEIAAINASNELQVRDDDANTSLASILADTAAMDTNLATLAGAVSGTEMQVDVITMPTVTVTATDFDIRDLTHTQDSIRIGDGTDFLAINADGSLNVTTQEDAYDVWQTSVLSATTTAGEIAATPLSGRMRIIVQNLGNSDVYLGEDNTVTTASGIKLPKGSSMEMKYGENANIFAITPSGTADLRVAEFAS